MERLPSGSFSKDARFKFTKPDPGDADGDIIISASPWAVWTYGGCEKDARLPNVRRAISEHLADLLGTDVGLDKISRVGEVEDHGMKQVVLGARLRLAHPERFGAKPHRTFMRSLIHLHGGGVNLDIEVDVSCWHWISWYSYDGAWKDADLEKIVAEKTGRKAKLVDVYSNGNGHFSANLLLKGRPWL